MRINTRQDIDYFLNQQVTENVVTKLSPDYFNPMLNNTTGGFNMGTNYLYLRQSIHLLNIYPSMRDHAEYTFENIVTSPIFDFVEGGVFKASLQVIGPSQYLRSILLIRFTLEFLIKLFQLSNNPLFLDYLNFNLNFIISNYKTIDGAYVRSIIDESNGRYYAYTKDILDAYAPLDFKRIDFTDNTDLATMVYSRDLYNGSQLNLKIFG